MTDLRKARRGKPSSEARRQPLAHALIRAMRPHQWAKNGLVFLGPLISLGLYDLALLPSVALVFAAFCMTASLVYLLNDVLDLAADRAHAVKRLRPLASGDLPVRIAVIACAVLAVAVALVAIFLPLAVGLVLLVYLVATSLYSVRLKEVAVVDLFLLATFYLARIGAGLVVVQQPLTIWLGGLLFFLFLNLALLKRFAELIARRGRARTSLVRRGYNVDDLGWISGAGMASAFAAAVTILLYAAFEPIADVYAAPEVLALLAPLFLGFMLWLWHLGAQGSMDEDTILFVLKSRAAYVVLLGAGAILAIARLGPGAAFRSVFGSLS